MRSKLLVFLCLINLTSIAQVNDPDLILWNDTVKLTWNDYTKIESSKYPYQAGTTYAIEFKDTCVNGKISLFIYVWFSKSRSWVVKKALKAPGLLDHERLHFDISEYHARLCRYKIAFLEKNCSDPSQVTKAINEANKNANAENLQYDAETNHGENKSKQKEWEAKVRARLKDSENMKLRWY